MAGTSIIREDLPIPGGIEGAMPAPSLGLAGTPYYATDTGNLFRCRDDGSAWDLINAPRGIALERGLVIGKGGALSSATDVADFPLVIPFDLTLTRLKAICAVAPSTAMTVQLRVDGADVPGFSLTFTPAQQTAIIDPADVDVSEGSVFNFSLGSASGSNMLLEIVGVAR